MKLYFAPRTRSVRPRWLLEELGVPYDLVRIDLAREENRTPEFLQLNPLAEVPVLVDGEVILNQAASMLLYLADRYPEQRFAPALSSPARAEYLHWLLFAEFTLEPLVLEYLRDMRQPEERPNPSEAQRMRLETVLNTLTRRLEGRSFIVGDGFTAADLSTASILHLAHTLGLLDRYPRLHEYTLNHAKRPAVRRALS